MPVIDAHAHVFPGDFGPPPDGCDPAQWPAAEAGSDFPAMPREEPCAKTLRSMGLPEADLADILWHNCFRFLGVEPPKLFSSRE